jgi:hypothetical protein
MKTRINQFFLLLFVGVLSLSVVTSCSDDDDAAPKEANMTGFKIVNAGPNGDLEVVAENIVVGENPTLSVPFGTDITKLETAIAISEGASVSPAAGTAVDFTEAVNFVVSNGDLSNVYIFAVEVQDAQSLEIKAYSAYSGDNAPGELADGNSRAAGSDDTYLYVPDKNEKAIYAIALADIKAGSVDVASAKKLSIEGIDFSNVSFNFSDVKVSGGNIYACSMSGRDGQWVNSKNLKVWKWANADATPELVFDWAIDFTRENMADYIRLGDAFTVNVDESGNGTIYVVNTNGAVKNEYYQFNISNFALNGTPTFHADIKDAGKKIGSYGTVFAAKDGELVISGADGLFLCAADGSVLVDVSTDAISARARGAQVFEYNDMRYLAYLTYNEGSDSQYFLQILDITGGTLEEAIKAITKENVESKTVYTSDNFHGAAKDGNSSGSLSIYPVSDGFAMTIFNAKNGFVYFEL